MNTWPHSVHSLRAVSSLLMVGMSRSVRAAAGGGEFVAHVHFIANTIDKGTKYTCIKEIELHVCIRPVESM